MISRPRLRTGILAAVALVVLVAAAGCGSSGDEKSDPSGTKSTASGSSSAKPTGTSYVALGDSFTAAPLVPDVDKSDPCLRSSNNYPHLVAKADPELTLTDVSCSGADATAMIGVQQIGDELHDAQFNSLGEDTQLVTLGLGGNDFGLYSTLLAECASSSDVNAAGQPCTDAATAGDGKDLTALIPQIQDRITAVVAGIKDRSPNARIMVVGYPQLFPATGSCDKARVAAGDETYVRTLTQGLDTALKNAAAAGGADYIDVYTASEGHDICSAEPWVNGKDTDPSAALAFHPFAVEQQAVAQLILEKLKS